MDSGRSGLSSFLKYSMEGLERSITGLLQPKTNDYTLGFRTENTQGSSKAKWPKICSNCFSKFPLWRKDMLIITQMNLEMTLGLAPSISHHMDIHKEKTFYNILKRENNARRKDVTAPSVHGSHCCHCPTALIKQPPEFPTTRQRFWQPNPKRPPQTVN